MRSKSSVGVIGAQCTSYEVLRAQYSVDEGSTKSLLGREVYPVLHREIIAIINYSESSG